MLNPNAKTFTFNPTATSCHSNAASTNESEGGSGLDIKFRDFGFVNEDDADDLSALVKGGEGLVGGAVSEGGLHYTERDYYYNNNNNNNVKSHASSSQQEQQFDDIPDEEKMRWLVREFPNIDEAILEDILFNAAHHDINCALDLLEELEGDYEAPVPEAPAINEEIFPSLGGGGAGYSSNNNNIAAKKEELPQKIYLSGGRSNYVDRQAPATSTWATSSHPPSSMTTRSTYFDSQNEISTKTTEWVETGDLVSNLYKENRADARDLAREKRLLRTETTAFLSGNKALAKELSAKGKEAECNATSSRASFESDILRKKQE